MGTVEVVALPGLGGSAGDWDALRSALSESGPARLVVADRHQDLGTAVDLASAVEHASRVARREDMDAPLVAAHSMGGLVAEALLRKRPTLASGVLLMDASVPRDLGWTSDLLGGMAGAARLAAIGADAVLSRVGVTRAGYWEWMSAENVRYRHWVRDLSTLRQRRPLPPTPIMIVTALPATAVGSWERQQTGYAALLREEVGENRVTHRVIRPAPHGVHASHPETLATWLREMAGEPR